MDHAVQAGEAVTLTDHIISKADLASVGVDEDTEFTVLSVQDAPDVYTSAKVILTDADGNEYGPLPVSELVFL